VISFAPGVIAELTGPPRSFTALLERPAALAVARRSLQSTDLVALSDMLLREFGRSAPGRPAALRGLLIALLANLLRLASQPSATHDGADARQRELVARLRRLIEAHYRTHTGIDVYAHSLGVSESKLRRVCLKVTGQTPIEMLHLRLLVEAERQLRYTTMSIAQIAYHLGFEDPAYFSRFFARHTQLAPRLFRSRDGVAGEPMH
jgi:AraC family transcriptional activator of pobA